MTHTLKWVVTCLGFLGLLMILTLPFKATAQNVSPLIMISIPDQTLVLYEENKEVGRWPISTSRYGMGNVQNSQKTPLGWHRVAQKIGANAALNTRFVKRQQTSETVVPILDESRMSGDYVTTRILWLEGMEPGINQGPSVDSFNRFIYIHGTPEEGLIGKPASHGCIRMRNTDVKDLFDRVPVGTFVYITSDSISTSQESAFK